MSTERKKQPALGRLSQQKYDIIKSKLDGGFKVPDKQQTKEQKQALNLLRKRKDFSIDTEGRLRCHEKIIIPAEKLTSEVKRLYEKSHGCGPRTLYNKMKETHTGFSVRNIVTILEKSELFHRQHPRFRNKPIPKTVWSSRPGKRWQIDVVSMANTSVEYKGDKYVYILQIVDVFSRYMMPQPLQSKQSSEIAKVLKTVILEHGAPNEIQCDNGKEFQGKQMRSLMQEFNIRMIHGRPYYPQSQGKCERSNRLLRRRIEFACTKNQGFNWVEGLSNIAHEINTSVKRILGNVTPFEAYHGRTHAGRPTNIRKIRRKMKHVLKKEQAYLKKKSGQPKNYRKGERVLIRYPFTKSRVPYKRHVLQGIVMKRNRNGTRYYIMYKRPMLRDFKQAWVGIENITSVTIEKEKQKKHYHRSEKSPQVPKSQHKEKYYQPLSHEDNLSQMSTSNLDVSILHDPKPDGNCQFNAISHQLSLIGIHRSGNVLREEATAHLRRNRNFYENFVYGQTYNDYLEGMTRDGTYGDNLTLVALMREFNLQCFVASARGPEFSSLISNDGKYDCVLPLLTLLHFPENAGMHYVSISVPREEVTKLISQTSSGTESDENGTAEPQSVDDEDLPQNSVESDVEKNKAETNERDTGVHFGEESRKNTNTRKKGRKATNVKSKYRKTKKTSDANSNDLSENVKVLKNQIFSQRQEMRKRRQNFPFFHLPLHIQAKIISMCLFGDPSFRYVLEHAGSRFRRLFQDIGLEKPQLHIGPSVLESVPNVVSVRLLSRKAGRGSGLLMEIRRIINNKRWFNAWLRLKISGIGWYEIVDIFYR